MPEPLELLRADAVDAFRAAVEAVHPRRLIPETVAVRRRRVMVAGRELPRVPGRRVLVALGKAGPALAAAWIERLPGWATEALVLAPHGVPVAPEVARSATVLRGTHPWPDGEGESAARRLLDLASGLDERDLLLVLLSGGASALLALPAAGLSLDDVRETTHVLLTVGAPIGALNTVRRQLLAAAGDGLARAAFPARVVSLVLSDVVGDPLPDIASGPTVPSPTGPGEALAVLEGFGVVDRLPRVVAVLREQSVPDPAAERALSERSRTVVLGSNRSAVVAAAASLATAGYRSVVVDRPLTGDAAARGHQLGSLGAALRPVDPLALILGGETTVRVRGPGRGGRCQELALAAAVELEGAGPCALLAAGTDGVDGVTAHAGAVVDQTTASRMGGLGVDPVAALDANDSGSALAGVGDVLVCGPTGTNVADLVLLLASPA